MSTAAGVMAIVLATALPLESQDAARLLQAGRGPSLSTGTLSTAILFSDLPEIDLRQPLVDSPTNIIDAKDNAPIVSEAAMPPCQVHLLGTMIEPGHSMGLFTDGTGKIEVHAVGDDIAGARIVEIVQDTATLQVEDRQVVIAVPATPVNLEIHQNKAPVVTTSSVMGARSANSTHSSDDDEMRKLLDQKPTIEQ